MAFGLGYNKAKILSAAEKYVMQGKIPAAIAEYSKILENEPRDLTILNIVGDLYLRINKTEDALRCFYKLGGAYLDDGFTRNAIAVYRRVLRAEPEQIDAILRLAELYTLQGQLNDARGYYQQAIEHFTRRGDGAKCVEVLEKALLLDPDNASLKQRLAVLYERAGQREEAAGLYLAVAEGLADQGKAADAERVLKTAQNLGASGPQSTQLEARILLDSGRAKDAVTQLSSLPPENLDKAALNLLFHAYSQMGELPNAAEVAKRLLAEHEDVAGMAMICEQLLGQSRYDEALAHYRDMMEPLLALRNTSPLVDGVKTIAKERPQDDEPLKLLREVFQRSERNEDLAETDERLAELAEQRGDNTFATELYRELSRLRPDNYEYADKLHALAGAGKRVAPAEPERAEMGLGEEFVAPPVITQTLTPKEQELLQTAMNDSELYVNYRQIDKAIQPLEALLGRLPTNIVLNERLIELYQRAGLGSKAAERSGVLAGVYREGGDAEKAAAYDAMAQGVGLTTAAASDPQAFSYAEFNLAPTPDAAYGATEEVQMSAVEVPEAEGVQEVDLSDWEAMMPPQQAAASFEADASAPPEAEIADLPAGQAKVEAFLAAGQIAEATTLLSSLQEKFAGAIELDQVAEKVAMAAMGIVAEPAAAPEPHAEPIFAPFETAPAEPAPDLGVELPPSPAVPESPGFDGATAAPVPPETPSETAAEPVSESMEAVPVEIPVEAPGAEPAAETLAPSPIAETPAPEEPVEGDMASMAAQQEMEAAAATPEAEVASSTAAAPEFVPAPAPAQPAAEIDFLANIEQPVQAEQAFELSLDEEPAKTPQPAVAAAPARPQPEDDLGFDSLVGALEAELQGVGPAPAAAPAQASAAAASAAAGAAAVPPASSPQAPKAPGFLSDVFEEFKEGMEEPGGDTDVDTHFNMGVAFKEMQLWDEAIGEFQKAYQAAERTRNYADYVRCCTLLSHCFQAKGLPAISVRWLENALKAPKLDQESVLALRYEIAAAHEMAGNKKAALESYLEVYALNIDYRDVAERIRELQGN